jgi:hypothetical protein
VIGHAAEPSLAYRFSTFRESPIEKRAQRFGQDNIFFTRGEQDFTDYPSLSATEIA